MVITRVTGVGPLVTTVFNLLSKLVEHQSSNNHTQKQVSSGRSSG